jgi:uncharacterized protein YndB with AHSA1/START domain
MYRLVQSGGGTMSQLHVEADGDTSADPAAVWALVSNANRYPEWGPWNNGGYRPPADGPSQVGSVQWFRYGRRTTSVERILEIDEGRSVAYTVIDGLPVKNYRAEVTLTASPSGGTHIRWVADWDSSLIGRVVQRKLQQVYREVITALVAAADATTR